MNRISRLGAWNHQRAPLVTNGSILCVVFAIMVFVCDAAAQSPEVRARVASTLPEHAVAQLGGPSFLMGISQPNGLIISPDGRVIATLALEKYGMVRTGLQLLDAKTGKAIPIKNVPIKSILGFAWHPNSRGFAIVAEGLGFATARLWIGDAKSGPQRPGPEFKTRIEDVAWSADGKRIAVATKAGKITLLAAQTLKPIRVIDGACWSLCFSNNSRLLASGEHTVTVWDAHNGNRDTAFKIPKTIGNVYQLRFSPNDQQLVIASRTGLFLWDRNEETLVELKHDRDVFDADDGHSSTKSRPQAFNSACFFDNGRKIAANIGFAGNRTGIWDVATQKLEQVIAGPLAWAVDAMPQTNQFVIGSARLVFCDKDGRMPTARAHFNGIVSFIARPDGGLISSGRNGTTHVWNLKTLRHVKPLEINTPVRSAALTRDGKAFMSVSMEPASIEIREVSNGASRWRWTPKVKPSDIKAKIEFTSIEPLTGTTFATGEIRNGIRFWDAGSPPPLKPPLPMSVPLAAENRKFGSRDFLTQLRASPDGRWLAAWTIPRTILSLIDTKTRRIKWSQEVGDTFLPLVEFVPQKNGIVTSTNEGIRFLHLETGKRLELSLDKYDGWVTSMAVSPSGKRIATATSELNAPDTEPGSEQFVRVWDLASGKQLASFRGHKAIAQSLTFSSDERFVVSGDEESRIFVWKLP